jgi:hypothetical protein
MSAAAIVIIRIKRIFACFKDRQATRPDSAMDKSEIPYSDRWYFRRLVSYGAVKQNGDKYYLDEQAACSYIRSCRIRGIIFILIAAALFGAYLLIRTLL